jgi:hypothetical protein
MVVAPLSATLTRLTFSIDIVVHRFIKLPAVTWNLGSTSTPACRAGATALTRSRLKLTIRGAFPCSFLSSFLSHLLFLIVKIAWFNK